MKNPTSLMPMLPSNRPLFKVQHLMEVLTPEKWDGVRCWWDWFFGVQVAPWPALRLVWDVSGVWRGL